MLSSIGKHKKWIVAGKDKKKLPNITQKYLKALEKVFPKSFVEKTIIPKLGATAIGRVEEISPPVLEKQIKEAPPPSVPKSEKEVVTLETDKTEEKEVDRNKQTVQIAVKKRFRE